MMRCKEEPHLAFQWNVENLYNFVSIHARQIVHNVNAL